MGLAMLVEVKEIKDKAILDVPVDAGERGGGEGQGHRQRARAGIAVAHSDRTT